MLSGSDFAFSDIKMEYVCEKLSWLQGKADPSAASWAEALLNCSILFSTHCVAEFDAVGHILIIFSLILHV